MDYQLEIDDAEKIAERGYKMIDLVRLFMKDKHENLFSGIPPRPDFRVRDNCLIGLWQRAYCWFKTLSKLNENSDFQAIATASRALLEIYVDMIFLHYDQNNDSSDKLFWWYKSEKLKAAELKYKFLNENNYEIDNQIIFFINSQKDEINRNRKRIWNIENKHPNIKRWTGHNLDVDVIKADELFLTETEKVMINSLEYFYETKYRTAHWDIHSGVSAFYDYSPQKFSLNNFFYFLDCSSFGILCTKLFCIDLGLNNIILNFDELFDELLSERDKLISE